MTHTATPWHIRKLPSGEKSNYIVSETEARVALGIEDGDAAFIVLACNAHDELVDLTRTLSQIVYTQNGNRHDDINALLERTSNALAKAQQ